jgi:predicted AlkP superfamily phosphohydrolase/phosphomutase
MESLFTLDAPTPKQGMHHPEGLLAFIGAGIAPGSDLGTCSNLDVAPTLLSLLAIPIPSEMKGRPLLGKPLPEPAIATVSPTAFPSPLQGA